MVQLGNKDFAKKNIVRTFSIGKNNNSQLVNGFHPNTLMSSQALSQPYQLYLTKIVFTQYTLPLHLGTYPILPGPQGILPAKERNSKITHGMERKEQQKFQ